MTNYFKYSQRTLTEVLEELTDNQDLRAVLGYCFGDYGEKQEILVTSILVTTIWESHSCFLLLIQSAKLAQFR